MFIVINHNGEREVGINADGSTSNDLERAELFTHEKTANDIARRYGGQVYTEDRIFGDCMTDDDYDLIDLIVSMASL
jgi:hypothetical protein